MPPKKKEKDEVIDISTLPPWFPLNVILKFDTKKVRAQAIQQKLFSEAKSFQKNISKNEILEYAKEKQLFVDPNSLSEKQKKDPKFMSEICTELTPAVMAKAFQQLQAEMDIQGRKDKKDKIDGVEAPIVDDKKKDPKKDPKKDVKKAGKNEPQQQQVEEEEVPKIQEKEYKKAMDVLYFLLEYPQEKAELDEINEHKCNIDLIINIQQKVQPIIVEEDIPQDEAEEPEEDEEGQQEPPEENIAKKLQEQEKITKEDETFINQNKSFIQLFKQTRSQAPRDSTLRRSVMKDIIYDVDPFTEEESLKQFIDLLIEEICQFSLDMMQFTEWIADKKQVPLQKPDQKEIEAQLLAQKKLEAELLAQQEAEKEKEAQKDKKGVKKEVVKKDLKKDDKIEEIVQQEKVEDQPIEPPKPVQDPFFTYYKQLNTVKLEETAPGLLLEVLLDELETEQINDNNKDFTIQETEQNIQVDSILSDLETFVQFSASQAVLQKSEKENKLQSQAKYNQNFIFQQVKGTQQKKIVDECDEIQKRAMDSKLFNTEEIYQREAKLFKNLNFPGIDRWMMPETALKSEQLRKAEKSQMYPFSSGTVQEFERKENLIRFEQILTEQDPEIQWNFGDRTFLERHNKNTLSQTLYKALLFDPTVVTKYNDRDDNLYMALYYKNPQGRMLRQKWSAEWKVLPNLENWINFFKNNENNLKNDFYYDIDYESIGNLHEYTKLLFPTDNAIIQVQKFMVGEKYQNRFKVLKENCVFGISQDLKGQANFFANFENQTKLAVEMESEEGGPLKAQASLTLQNGLIVKFLSNSDVFQQCLSSEHKKMRRDFQEIVNPNIQDPSNSEIELKRIISGRGSVIRYMKDGSTIIYYSNGNMSFTKNQNSPWITTNNKGLRKTRSKIDGGSESEFDPIPCARRTDPQTGSKIIIRGDQTIIIQYLDKSVLVKYVDGTQIFTSTDHQVIIVEHPSYATTKITYSTKDESSQPLTPECGYTNLFERTQTNRIVETFLPDGSRFLSFQQKGIKFYQYFKEFQSNPPSGVILGYFCDGSVLKVQETGQLFFIESGDRENLGESSEGYWQELFKDSECRGGVYGVCLESGRLYTRDDDGNRFILYADGSIQNQKKIILGIQSDIQDIENYNQNAEEKLLRPPTIADLPDGDFVDEELKVLQRPNKFLQPRLFIINNDNSGAEIFTQQQLKSYFSIRSKDPETIQFTDQNLPNYEKCDSFSFITKYKTLKQRKQNYINCQIPKNLDILTHTKEIQKEPESQIYLFRNLLQFSPFDEENREKHSKDLEKYEIWKKDQLKQQQDYGVGKKEQSEQDQQFDIQLKILESRRTDYSDETYNQVVRQFDQWFFSNVEILNEYKKLQSQQKEVLTNEKDIKVTVVPDFTVDFYAKKSLNLNKNSFNQMKQEIQQAKQPVEKYEIPKPVTEQQVIKEVKEEKWEDSIKQQQRKDYFVSHYFDTVDGFNAFRDMLTKKEIDLNPVVANKLKALSQEAIAGKTQEQLQMERKSQENSPLQDQEQAGLQNSQKMQSTQGQAQVQQDYQQQKTIIIKPSVFAQRDVDEFQRQQRESDEAAQQRYQKSKNVNVYGQERKEHQKKNVPCLLKTNPKSELNQKYILTESVTDNRMKIASMHSRLYLKAPGINEIRNTGSHSALASTIDKRNNLDEVEGKKNLMITSDLNDQLRKDLLIFPVAVRFGMLRTGGIYETTVTIKNEDLIAQRVTLKNTATKYVRVFTKQTGPIALGLTREITVRIDANAEIYGRFQDEFQIVSKHEIYKIPVYANIMDAADFDRLDNESKELNKKSVLKNNIREINFNADSQQRNQDLMDSANSDLLPKLNNYNKEYKIDPYISLKKKKNADEDDSIAD